MRPHFCEQPTTSGGGARHSQGHAYAAHISCPTHLEHGSHFSILHPVRNAKNTHRLRTCLHNAHRGAPLDVHAVPAKSIITPNHTLEVHSALNAVGCLDRSNTRYVAAHLRRAFV